MKRKLALIGKDISYSLSPLIHGEIFREMGYDATYELFSVDKDELPALVKKLKSEYVGFNITKPHKQNILPYLDDTDLKSVNTVRVDGDKLHGYSTDGYGFSRDLKIRFGEKIHGTALVLGAGGVARVIVDELKKLGFDVYIRNRTVARAEALADEFGAHVADESVKPDLVVNCTSYGFNRGENPALAFDEQSGRDHWVFNDGRLKWMYDTIYSPPVTDFLASFPSAERANGLGMLILQAIEADRIMCGFDIDDDLEKKLYADIMRKIKSRI